MNRTIALFVALVILIAHVLAIHNDGEGSFAYPYDQAYVPIRLARNLVFEGRAQWNPGSTAWESYPSLTWVALAAAGERLAASRLGEFVDISVNHVCQMASALSMLLAVVIAAQLRPRRAAGLIAPLLLVTSGCAAAAAASGLETALFAFLVITAFASAERGRSWTLAVSLALACLTRPEGAVVAVALLALQITTRIRGEGRRRDKGAPPTAASRALWPFLLPIAATAGGMLVRARMTGFELPPACFAILHPRPGQASEGLASLRDFAIVAVSPGLLLYPLYYLFRARLSGTGARALFVALSWIAFATLQGRGPLPFAEAFVPALPLIAVAAQEGMIEALDGAWRPGRKLALALLSVCLVGSALASKQPGDLGPLPTERWHERWLASSGSARFGYRQPLGRLGLVEEIDLTSRLRAAGVFMRDYLDPSWSVLTPWPGSIGYLSRLQVLDLLGRTNPMPGLPRPASWTRREGADVVEALEQAPDYVVPFAASAARIPSPRELAESWISGLDARASEAGRIDALAGAFARYELLAIPIRAWGRAGAASQGTPFLLLRRRDLGLRPKLEVEIAGRSFRVIVRHHAHPQLADLRVELVDARGRVFCLRPTGDVMAGSSVLARTDILLYNTGSRPIELMRGELPDALDRSAPVEMRAELRNPGCAEEHAFATVSEKAVARID